METRIVKFPVSPPLSTSDIQKEAEAKYGPTAKLLRTEPSVSQEYRLAVVQVNAVKGEGLANHVYIYDVGVTQHYKVTVFAPTQDIADEETGQIDPREGYETSDYDDDWNLSESSDPETGTPHQRWLGKQEKK